MDFKGGLGGILQSAMKMREEMERIQASLVHKTVEATVGGGMVKVTANGKLEILSVTLDPELVKQADRDMLQDLVRAGVNQALKSAQEVAAAEMKSLTANLGPLAGMFGAKP